MLQTGIHLCYVHMFTQLDFLRCCICHQNLPKYWSRWLYNVLAMSWWFGNPLADVVVTKVYSAIQIQLSSTKSSQMVNGLHLYSAFIQSTLQFMPLIHTNIRPPTAIGCQARYQPARQEQLGVRRLAQGHSDTPRVGSNREPSDCSYLLSHIAHKTISLSIPAMYWTAAKQT